VALRPLLDGSEAGTIYLQTDGENRAGRFNRQQTSHRGMVSKV